MPSYHSHVAASQELLNEFKESMDEPETYTLDFYAKMTEMKLTAAHVHATLALAYATRDKR